MSASQRDKVFCDILVACSDFKVQLIEDLLRTISTQCAHFS